MYTKQTTIANAAGLHARPAADFVKRAKEYESTVTVRRINGGEPVNAKSIVRLLAGAFSKGVDIEIAADGADEVEAVNALISLVESDFGE